MYARTCRTFAVALVILVSGGIAVGDDRGAIVPDAQSLLVRLKQQYGQYTAEYQDQATGLLYVATVQRLTTQKRYAPENARQGLVDGEPSPHGYGTPAGDSGMSDTSLFGGQMLYAMLEAYDARRDPQIAAWARRLFDGMKIIGAASPVPGFIVRGPHPLDRKAYYRDSSMDQHSTFVIALWRYYHSPLATDEDRQFIRDALDRVARRLEKNRWRILWEDDSRDAHAGGGDLAGMFSESALLLLPFVGAAADVTGNEHWRKLYDRFAEEKDGQRWKVLLPDQPGFRMNAHLQWGQQAIFRAHCLYGMEKDPLRRKLLLAHVRAYTEHRLAQPFPPQQGKGALFEIFHRMTLSPEEAARLNWTSGFFPGPVDAWRAFKPEHQRVQPVALRAKVHEICVLFPSSVFTMALFSRDRGLEGLATPLAADMLEKVDLTQLGGWARWGVVVAAWKAYALQARTKH